MKIPLITASDVTVSFILKVQASSVLPRPSSVHLRSAAFLSWSEVGSTAPCLSLPSTEPLTRWSRTRPVRRLRQVWRCWPRCPALCPARFKNLRMEVTCTHHRPCACTAGLTCLAPSVPHTLSSNGVIIARSLLKISQQQRVSRHISFSIFTSPRILSLAQLSSLIARTECHGCISSGIFHRLPTWKTFHASVLKHWRTKRSPEMSPTTTPSCHLSKRPSFVSETPYSSSSFLLCKSHPSAAGFNQITREAGVDYQICTFECQK